MTGAFVLVWITCQPPSGVSFQISAYPFCFEQRQYFDTMDECITARHALPADDDGLQPLIAACATVRKSP